MKNRTALGAICALSMAGAMIAYVVAMATALVDAGAACDRATNIMAITTISGVVSGIGWGWGR